MKKRILTHEVISRKLNDKAKVLHDEYVDLIEKTMKEKTPELFQEVVSIYASELSNLLISPFFAIISFCKTEEEKKTQFKNLMGIVSDNIKQALWEEHFCKKNK